MASDNGSRKLPKKKVTKKKTSKKAAYPKIYRDKENSYTSIKLKAGVETNSYLKGGILFLENDEKEIVEIQILN